MHGPIGFEPYWLRVQGYAEKNLLQLIADQCFKRDIGICAVTSQSDQVDETGVILRGTVHDRLGFLTENHLASLPRGYDADTFGEDSIVVMRHGKRVYLVNGQTVIVQESGKIFDHLVVGSNSVPNLRVFQDTLQYCNDNGLTHGLEHPDVEEHFGAGLGRAEQLVEKCDFVEAHNAQLRWSRAFSKFPVIGPYTRAFNAKAERFAKQHDKPIVANSDAHRIQSAGIASNEFEKDDLDFSSEDNLFRTMRRTILSGNFKINRSYESRLGWISWVGKFKAGIKGEKYKTQ